MGDTLYATRKRSVKASGITIHASEFIGMAADLGRYGCEALDRKADRAYNSWEDTPRPEFIARIKEGAGVYKIDDTSPHPAVLTDYQIGEKLKIVGYLHKVGGKWTVSTVSKNVRFCHRMNSTPTQEVGSYLEVVDGKEQSVEVSCLPVVRDTPISLPTTNPLFPQALS